MANPLTTKRNQYNSNRKDSNIYTPENVAKFLKQIIQKSHIFSGEKTIIFDPAVGSGRLLNPYKDDNTFRQYSLLGYDIYDDNKRDSDIIFVKQDFLQVRSSQLHINKNDIALVICNPPFNDDGNSLYKKKLLPELFAKHIFDLFGCNTPLILFTPMGFRLNQRKFSKRWKSFRDNYCSEITSIISLPLDIFPSVEFHNEILIWNIPDIKAHYWLPEDILY